MILKEVMIIDGMYEHQNGRVQRIDSKTYTIPFAEVHLRNKDGSFKKRNIAFVPAKYCVEFDVSALRESEIAKCKAKYGEDSPALKRLMKLIDRADSKIEAE